MNPETAASPARLFFALWLPQTVARQLHTRAGGIVGRSGGRLAREESLHLTLAFLGEVDERRLPELQRLAADLRLPRVPVRLDRLGFWKHNHIVWAGCGEAAPELTTLAGELQRALVAAGFLDAERAVTPHVTLLRKAAHPGELPALPAQEWSAGELVLARTWRTDRGSTYEPMARWPLQ
ncbi:MAG: RNA 2',3'-cyclic phosphodiesterase [Rhodocyclales bacterium]|nr:RNA 2',3'-cyclic phosphodiesterase [Rhodocyclales bacterium]